MPRRTLRLSVGDLTLAVEAERRTSALDPPPELEPFLVRRGSDIRLVLTTDSPPVPRGRALFDSGGVWRVFRHGDGLLYEFHIPQLKPPVYKAVTIDRRLRKGRLFFPGIEGGPGSALDYPLDELLFQHRLAREGALEVHACGLEWRGRTVVLCGQSGAGKSTTARLWRRHTRGTLILSDDRVVLRPRGAGVRAWGTPWHGDGGFSSPRSRTLGALFFLKQGPASRVRPIPAPAAAGRLLARGFPPPWDSAALGRSLETCAAITAAVPAYELTFRPDRTAVEAVQAVAATLADA